MKNLMFRLATMLTTGGGEGGISSNTEVNDLWREAYKAFKGAISVILPIVLAVLAGVGIFFGISLGLKFAKAEDADARDKAKTQLINLAIGIGVAAVIIVVCIVLVKQDVFADMFKNAFTPAA